MGKTKEMLENFKEEIKIAFKELDQEFEEELFGKEEDKEELEKDIKNK